MKLGAFFAVSGVVVTTFFALACSSSDPATSPGSTSDSGASDGATTDAPSGSDGGKDAGSDAQVADDDGGLFVITGGTFDALTLNPVDGTAFISTTGSGSELIVLIADKPSLCTTGVSRQNEISFSIDAQSGMSVFPPGTYTQTGADGPGQVDPTMSQIGPTCLAIGQDYGAENGSTVVVTNVTSTYVSGTFDITFQSDAGTLQGAFHVPICGQAVNTTCQP